MRKYVKSKIAVMVFFGLLVFNLAYAYTQPYSMKAAVLDYFDNTKITMFDYLSDLSASVRHSVSNISNVVSDTSSQTAASITSLSDKAADLLGAAKSAVLSTPKVIKEFVFPPSANIAAPPNKEEQVFEPPISVSQNQENPAPPPAADEDGIKTEVLRERISTLNNELNKIKRNLSAAAAGGLVVSAPVIQEKTIEKIASGVSAEEFNAKIAELNTKINASSHAITLTNRINNISGATINNPTFTGSVHGLSLDYLALTGGTLTGSLTGTSATFSGQLTISGTATSTIAGDTNFDSGTLYVDSLNNRVGVGTTSPSETFSLNGPAYFSQISAPSVTADRLYNASGDLYWAGSLVGSASVGNWTLASGNVYRSSGNVGIGTTSPYATLSVEGSSALGNSALAGYFTATTTTATSTFPYLAATTALRLGSDYFTDITGANLSITDGVLNAAGGASDWLKETNYGALALTASNTIPYWAKDAIYASSTLIVAGNTTLSSATSTNFYSTNLGLNSEYFSDLTGTGLQNSSGVLTLNATGDWTGTIDGNNFAGGAIGIGDLLYGGGAGSISELAMGASSTILTTNGTTPAWTATSSLGFIGLPSIDTFAELDTIVADKALVNLEDNQTFSGLMKFSNTSTTTLVGGLEASAIGAPVFYATSTTATSTFAGGLAVETSGLVYDYSTGNVGVGTTTPWAKLAVNPVAGDVNQFVVGSSTATSFVITPSGNVGIGTAGPGAKLEVSDSVNAGKIRFTRNAGSNFGDIGIDVAGANYGLGLWFADTQQATFYDTGLALGSYVAAGNDAPTGGLIVSGNVGVGSTTPWGKLSVDLGSGTTPVFVVGDETSPDSTPFIIDASGLVGIGTTSPYAKLSVEGSSALGNSALAGYFTATTSTASVFPYASSTAISSTGGAWFATSGGNVGVGTTSPWAKLAVNPIAGDTNQFVVGSSTATSFVITPAGNVGIGNTAPLGLLTVGSGSSAFTIGTNVGTGAWLINDGSNTIFSTNVGSIFIGYSGAGGSVIHLGNDNPGVVQVTDNAPTGSLVIPVSGFVGIATSSPYARLSVEGESALGNSALAGYFTATTTTATSTFSGGLSLAGGGISPGFNFSTTTRFYQNGVHFMTSSTTAGGNLALGYQTSALMDETGGTQNTYFGYQAGQNATSSLANTGFGFQALQDIINQAGTPGDYNSAFGALALTANTIGRYNMAIGYNALAANTEGINNTAVGAFALDSNTTGGTNMALGSNALSANTTASNNVAIGSGALQISDAAGNIAVGTNAGKNITSGTYNIIIGYNAGAPNYNGSNQLNIGNILFGTGVSGLSTVSSSSVANAKIGIGTTTPYSLLSVHKNSLDTNYAPIFTVASSTATATTTLFTVLNSGFIGVGTSSPKYNLAVQSSIEGDMSQLYDTDGNCLQDPDSGGITTTCSSDIRLKTDIAETAPVLDYFINLPIKDYTIIASGSRFTGVIAQDLLEKYPELVAMGQDGYYGVKEIRSWKIIKAIQELNLKIEDLAAKMPTPSVSLSETSVENSQTLGVVDESFAWMLDQFKNIGITISNGAVKAREFIADKIIARKVVTEAFEMKDSVTGDVYCVRISQGEWNKFRGTCGENSPLPSPPQGEGGERSEPGEDEPGEDIAPPEATPSVSLSETSVEDSQTLGVEGETASTTPTEIIPPQETSSSTPETASPLPSPSQGEGGERSEPGEEPAAPATSEPSDGGRGEIITPPAEPPEPEPAPEPPTPSVENSEILGVGEPEV